MYEARQNKVISSHILPCCKKKCTQHICDNRIFKQNIIQNSKKEYEFIASNRPVQGVFVSTSEAKQYSFTEIEDYVIKNSDDLTEFVDSLKQYNLTMDEVLRYIEEICDNEELKFECLNIPASIEITLQYLAEKMPKDTVVTPEDIQVLPEEHFNMALTGLYNRFPTIYSYSMAASSQQINENLQGPHTLSHVSTDYLLDNMMEGYDWRSQVPSPEEVETILCDIEVLDTTKTKRYLEDYKKKYFDLFFLIEQGLSKPTAILRELMEMHPMAVYSWRGNINKEAKGVAASKKSLMGKGELYGNKITVDKRWRPIGVNSESLSTHPMTIHMLNFLMLRLSMVIPNQENQRRIALELLDKGEYIITDNDKM